MSKLDELEGFLATFSKVNLPLPLSYAPNDAGDECDAAIYCAPRQRFRWTFRHGKPEKSERKETGFVADVNLVEVAPALVALVNAAPALIAVARAALAMDVNHRDDCRSYPMDAKCICGLDDLRNALGVLGITRLPAC